LKQATLAILGTGIIGENGLKGHARHKKNFPVNQRDLISALIETHFKYCDVKFFPGDILKRFDSYFDSMAALARIADATDFQIKQAKDNLKNLRDKIFLAVSQGNFPSNWREIMKEELISSYEYHPKTEAQAFAIIFLEHAHGASNRTIVKWVNASLKSLGRRTASATKLRENLQKEREIRPWLPQESSTNHP
jgi:hypothetical protein